MGAYTFSVRTDLDRNVMYISQNGKPSAADFERLKTDFLTAVDDLTPGFSIVNDQRSLEPFDDKAMVVARQLVALTNQRGASRVIRIVPANLVSTTKISRTLVTGKSNYASTRVVTPEEAEDLLQDC